LRKRFADRPSVEIVEADVLTVDLGAIAGENHYVVGNVPYYITTPILFHALQRPRARRSVFLVQREVAERIVAEPGSKEYGALSVNVQAVAKPKYLFRVAPGSFLPPPKVESAVIRIEPRDQPAISENSEEAFRRFVIDAFGMRRKQMRRILRSLWNLSAEGAEAVLASAGIEPSARPESLTPEQLASVLERR
jgi:16S rRNA (adenine1518-N6/adenine1519-N6)-dimethyltransferase